MCVCVCVCVRARVCVTGIGAQLVEAIAEFLLPDKFVNLGGADWG